MNLGGSVKINKCGMLIFTLIVVLLIYYMTLSKKDSSNVGGVQKDPNYINLRKLLIGSIHAAKMGGIEVVAVSKDKNLHEQSKGKTLEGANDPVSFMVNRLKLLNLNQYFPGHLCRHPFPLRDATRPTEIIPETEDRFRGRLRIVEVF